MSDIASVLRARIRKSGMTNYAISMKSGVEQSVLSRFMNKQSGISLDTMNRILKAIGAKVTIE